MSSKFTALVKQPKQGSKKTPKSAVRRMIGRSSNPEYRQASAWIRNDTLNQVGSILILQYDRREFSDLVQELLDDWLAKQK